MAARIIEIADDIKATIENWWRPNRPSRVERRYLPRTTQPGPAGFWLDGRRVYVMATGPVEGIAITRADDDTTFTLWVVISEKYPKAGEPPTEWVDERVNWVDSLIKEVLDNPRTGSLFADGTLVPDTVNWASVYDYNALLTTPGGFVSEIELTYRLIAPEEDC